VHVQLAAVALGERGELGLIGPTTFGHYGRRSALDHAHAHNDARRRGNTKFELIETKPFGSGVVGLTYKPAPK
jgi:hypothetical protein